MKLKRNSTFKFIEETTDMPPVSLSDIPYIELSGKNHAEIEGIYKISEYTEKTIKLEFKKDIVSFEGYDLVIKYFTDKSAIIKGNIKAVSFSDRG